MITLHVIYWKSTGNFLPPSCMSSSGNRISIFYGHILFVTYWKHNCHSLWSYSIRHLPGKMMTIFYDYFVRHLREAKRPYSIIKLCVNYWKRNNHILWSYSICHLLETYWAYSIIILYINYSKQNDHILWSIACHLLQTQSPCSLIIFYTSSTGKTMTIFCDYIEYHLHQYNPHHNCQHLLRICQDFPLHACFSARDMSTYICLVIDPLQLCSCYVVFTWLPLFLWNISISAVFFYSLLSTHFKINMFCIIMVVQNWQEFI